MNKKIICGIFSAFMIFFLIRISSAADVSFENAVGISTIKEFLFSIIRNLQKTIALIAVLFIVIGGVVYITAGESTERIKLAKNIWVGSIIGMLIAFLAPTFLSEISKDFLKDGKLPTDINEVLTLTQVITNVISTLLSIIGVLTIISLVISGFTYLFSFGDSTRAGKAKEMIKWSIVGLALAGASVIIVRQVASFILTKEVG